MSATLSRTAHGVATATSLRSSTAAIAIAVSGCASPAAWSPTLEVAAKDIQPTPQDSSRVLPFEVVKNGRDLGGLTGDAGAIPTNRFFRTASLGHANEHDRTLMLERGVTTDIDLRTYWEAAFAPDALSHDSRFHYERISLYGFGLVDWISYTWAKRGDTYTNALEEHPEAFRDVFHAMASQPAGAVVFHCASGKDRTGLVAAMLLSLAGVRREAIVHDYAVSAHYLYPDATTHEDLAKAISAAPPYAIEQFLEALDDRYGGAAEYLREAGLSEADLSALRKRLGQE